MCLCGGKGFFSGVSLAFGVGSRGFGGSFFGAHLGPSCLLGLGSGVCLCESWGEGPKAFVECGRSPNKNAPGVWSGTYKKALKLSGEIGVGELRLGLKGRLGRFRV